MLLAEVPGVGFTRVQLNYADALRDRVVIRTDVIAGRHQAYAEYLTSEWVSASELLPHVRIAARAALAMAKKKNRKRKVAASA